MLCPHLGLGAFGQSKKNEKNVAPLGVRRSHISKCVSISFLPQHVFLASFFFFALKYLKQEVRYVMICRTKACIDSRTAGFLCNVCRCISLVEMEIWAQARFIALGMTQFVNQWDAECHTSTFLNFYSKEGVLHYQVQEVCSYIYRRPLIKGGKKGIIIISA